MSTGSFSRLVRISSQDRLTNFAGGDPTNFTVHFRAQPGIQNVQKIFLVEWSCPNLFTNVDKWRNRLYIKDDAGYHGYVDIPVGQYDINTIIPVLENAVNVTGFTPPYPEPLTVTLNAILPEGRLEVTLGAPLSNQLEFTTLSELAADFKVQSSLNELIGGTAYQDVAIPAGQVGPVPFPNVVNLAGRKAVYLTSNNIASGNSVDSSGYSTDVIGVLPLGDVQYGQNATGAPTHPQNSIINYSSSDSQDNSFNIDASTFIITDSQGQQLDLPDNQEVTILFRIFASNH